MRPLLILLGTWLLASPAWPASVKFSDALYQKFHHDRCLQCHQFNSKRSNGRAYHSHRARYLCENCHSPRLTGLRGGEWMAPQGARMDYTGMDAHATCEMAKRNTGPVDRAQALTHHLLHDARVLWALKNGVTPAGRRELVPGGYEEWTRDVNAWVAGGMVCD